MNKSNDILIYNDIWYGNLRQENSKDFECYHKLNIADFKKILLDLNFKIVEIPTLSKKRTDIHFFKVLDKNNNRYNLLCETLKHSGINKTYKDKDTIRVHINPMIKQNSEDRCYLFGCYKTGDKYLIVTTELTNYLSKSSITKNNSSFWVGTIKDLLKIYNLGEYDWKKIKSNTLFHGIELSKLTKLSQKEIIKKLFDINILDNKNIVDEQSSTEISNFNSEYNVEPRDIDIDNYSKYKLDTDLPRNHKYRELAFKNANYTCELCGNKETFRDKNGNEYFEGHHLIMYNITSQKRYKKCLDIPKNIVCLCPNCHKKIHQAEDNEMKKGLMILFAKHNELFEIYEIENMDDILSDYKQERKGRI